MGEILGGLQIGEVCAYDAASVRHLKVVALASIRAEATGEKMVYRTAASSAGIRILKPDRNVCQHLQSIIHLATFHSDQIV